MRRKKEKRRWEVYETGLMDSILVPTLREKREKKMSDREYIMACFEAHKVKNRKCFRETHGHKLCELCPKSLSSKPKIEIETFPPSKTKKAPVALN